MLTWISYKILLTASLVVSSHNTSEIMYIVFNKLQIFWLWSSQISVKDQILFFRLEKRAR